MIVRSRSWAAHFLGVGEQKLRAAESSVRSKRGDPEAASRQYVAALSEPTGADGHGAELDSTLHQFRSAGQAGEELRSSVPRLYSR